MFNIITTTTNKSNDGKVQTQCMNELTAAHKEVSLKSM